ncbi:MAG TPA: tetratricopeptide repeat protein [Chthoniobacterales bacterium]|jgi:tetratricopeptide (TPR) repeat protein|nr:tetratricopeptide repeat protein [Chthoniobacterales bacterium]
MKTLFVVCLVTALGLSMAKSAQQEGNPQAVKIARDASQAAKDQDWNKAIDGFRKAAEMDRKYTQNLAVALQQRAFSYANDQRFQDALNDLDEALKIKPDARAYEQRAAIEMKINDYDRALGDYELAIKANPGEIKYHLYRGYIYELRGDLQNAMAETDAALKINSKNKEAVERKQRLQKIQSATAPAPSSNAPGVAAPPAPPKKKP